MINVYVEDKPVIRGTDEFSVGQCGKIVTNAVASGMFADKIFTVVRRHENGGNLFVFLELSMAVDSIDMEGFEAEVISSKTIKMVV